MSEEGNKRMQSFRRSGSFARQPSRAGESRKDVTSTELANYHRLFTTFDVDNSGYLEFDELQFLLRCLGIFLDDENMQMMKDEFDEDDNGLLDFEEFVSLMHRTGELTSLRLVSEEEERKHITKVVSRRFTAEAKWRWVWDTLILFVTGYYVLRCTYEFYQVNSLNVTSIVFEVLMNIILIIDIVIYGNTAYQDSTGKNIEGLKDVAVRYLTSYFIFDLVGALPLDLLMIAGDSAYAANIVFRVFRGLRLLRCIRVAKTLYLNTSITGLLTPQFVYFSYHVTPVLRSLFFLAFSMHLLTVGWLIVRDAPDENYVDSLYLVLFTVTTVGYGDIVITGTAQRLYCCFLFLCGVLVNGIVISQMSVFMQKADIASERNDKMRETLAVLTHFDIPSNIQSEILSFQNHLLEHNLGSSHASLISSLPVSIQESLALFMKIKYISMVPMFETANHDCRIALAQCLINIVFRPQEFIIIAGETGKEMYFLGHGIADVIHPKGNYLATLRKGNFFGEIALIVDDAHRTASIKALTYCDVFRLEKRDFSMILKKFPAFRDSVKEQMEERVKQFQAQGNTNIIPSRKGRLEKINAKLAEDQQAANNAVVPINENVKSLVAEAQKVSVPPHAHAKKSRSGRFPSNASSFPAFETASMTGSVDDDTPVLSQSTYGRAKDVANKFGGGGMAFGNSTHDYGLAQMRQPSGVFGMPGFAPAPSPTFERHQSMARPPSAKITVPPTTFASPATGANANQEFRALMDRMNRIESYLAEQAEGSPALPQPSTTSSGAFQSSAAFASPAPINSSTSNSARAKSPTSTAGGEQPASPPDIPTPTLPPQASPTITTTRASIDTNRRDTTTSSPRSQIPGTVAE